MIRIPVSSVEVPSGRRTLRGVSELADSIHDLGLLNPITVVIADEEEVVPPRRYRLVAGAHRLAAAKKLGWEAIAALVLELSEVDAELAEIDENICRNDLTVLERAENFARRKVLFEAKWPETRHVTERGGPGRGKKTPPESGAVSPPKQKAFIPDTSAKAGRAPSTIREEVQIATRIDPSVRDAIRGTDLADNKTDLVDLSRLPPQKQKEVVAQVQAGAKGLKEALGAVKQEKKAAQAAALRAKPLPTPKGPFGVIVADPPWPFDTRTEDATHRGNTDYPLMTLAEICALPVAQLAAKDCILWLWTTNTHLIDGSAARVLQAWGFQGKTLLTWSKDRFGLGNWLRNITEHCVLAVRGRPLVDLHDQTTHIVAPRRQHSQKPDRFFELVESLCPDRTRLEMFAREARPGWIAWGADAGKLDRGAA